MKLPPGLTDLPRTLLPLHVEPDLPTPDGLSSTRIAAVLVLLFPRGGAPHFLLTVRPETLTRHAGQISLPGGAAEPGDFSLWHTALRETQEELGIRMGRLQALGRLEPVSITASNYLIVPFVAWNPIAPKVRPDPVEVAEVLEIPVATLLEPESLREEKWELRGRWWHVSFYRLGGRTVWGATARILGSLANRLQGDEVEPTPAPGSVRPA